MPLTVRVWRYSLPLPENLITSPSPESSVLLRPPIPRMEYSRPGSHATT